MDKTFICLANSYKHGNRCIVGVEIEFYPDSNTFVVKRDAFGNPVWFRPINRTTESGAIPNDEALSVSILDVVKAHEVEPHPEGAQQENHYYQSLTKLSSIANNVEELDKFVDRAHRTLFGNKGCAVHPDKYKELNYSAIFIKSSEVMFYLKDRTQYDKEPQPRCKLNFKGNEYDLPVTDPVFRQIIVSELDKSNTYTDYYITLSLGVEHDDWHSKLIACVIPVS